MYGCRDNLRSEIFEHDYSCFRRNTRTVFLIFRPRLGPLKTFDKLTRTAVILDIVVVLSHQQLLGRLLEMLCAAILVQHALSAGLLEIVFLVLKLLVHERRLRWARLEMDRLPTGLGLPGKELKFVEVAHLAGKTVEVVASVRGVFGVVCGLWRLTHRAGLGIVIGRLGVQVAEVFCSVFTDAQVADGDALGSQRGQPPNHKPELESTRTFLLSTF